MAGGSATDRPSAACEIEDPDVTSLAASTTPGRATGRVDARQRERWQAARQLCGLEPTTADFGKAGLMARLGQPGVLVTVLPTDPLRPALSFADAALAANILPERAAGYTANAVHPQRGHEHFRRARAIFNCGQSNVASFRGDQARRWHAGGFRRPQRPSRAAGAEQDTAAAGLLPICPRPRRAHGDRRPGQAHRMDANGWIRAR